MSKWDIPKRKQIKVKPKEVDPICRVVPPLLARIPDISDWLFKDRTVRMSTTVPFDLKKAYRTIAELIEYHHRKDDF